MRPEWQFAAIAAIAILVALNASTGAVGMFVVMAGGIILGLVEASRRRESR